MTPTEELRAAARLVRETAAKVEHGSPWVTDEPFENCVMACDVMVADADPGSAVWIALMSPAIAEPLAAWLDKTAADYDWLIDVGIPLDAAQPKSALAVARAINGGDQ